VVQPPDLRWHLPSIEVSPDESPRLARFLDHVEVGVAIHGYGRDGHWSTLLVCGGNRDLADHVGGHLQAALDDHEVRTDLAAIPAELRGVHAANPVNLLRGGGVQLELPPGVRGLTPRWAEWTGPAMPPPAEALVDALVAAAASWPAQGDSRSSRQPADGAGLEPGTGAART
jgi:phage replication-related protein YjqB (UPF0714/DUF867 family)